MMDRCRRSTHIRATEPSASATLAGALERDKPSQRIGACWKAGVRSEVTHGDRTRVPG
jgi:hypothetical protein